MWCIMQLIVGSKIFGKYKQIKKPGNLVQKRKTLLRNITPLEGYLRIVHFQWRKGKGKSTWIKAEFTKATIATTIPFGTPTTDKLSGQKRQNRKDDNLCFL
jgi:hypothetical protein